MCDGGDGMIIGQLISSLSNVTAGGWNMLLCMHIELQTPPG